MYKNDFIVPLKDHGLRKLECVSMSKVKTDIFNL